MTAAVIPLNPTPRPGDRFNLRNPAGDAIGRVVAVDSVYRVRSGRAMVVGVIEVGPRRGEVITVEFRDGRQSGWRHEHGLSDIGGARASAERWQRLVETGEVEHGDEEGGVA